MQTPIPLFVDEIFQGGFRAITLSGSKIMHNLNAIDHKEYEEYSDMLSEYNEANIYLPAGRFITMSAITLDEKKANMMIIDLLDSNPQMMNATIAALNNVTNNNREDLIRFLQAVKKIKYSEDYNKFILLEGKR